MTGLPTREQISEFVAISEAQATGPLPMILTPIMVDERGYAFGICPDDDDVGAYVYAGLRLGWAPMPVQGGLLLSIWGGHEAEPGFEEDGVVAFITRDGLRRLATDLLAIADAGEQS